MSSKNRILFTSESVTEGHPDKIADQISDAVLDACLAEDPASRVACETLTCTGLVVIAGEITTRAYVDFQALVRGTISSIGYDNALYGFDSNTCAVISSINKQSGPNGAPTASTHSPTRNFSEHAAWRCATT